MRITIALLIALMFTGCAGQIVKQKFPDAPIILLADGPDLKTIQIDPTNNLPVVKLSDIMNTVAKNYGTYYEERERLRGWIMWYKEQKEITDKLNK